MQERMKNDLHDHVTEAEANFALKLEQVRIKYK